MKRLISILSFFRIVDAHDETLSITNIALYIVLYKLTMAPAINITDVGALVIALGNYSIKKIINKNTPIGLIADRINPDLVKDSNV